MTHHPIELGIALLRELVEEDSTLQQELRESRRSFFSSDPPEDQDSPARILADRRHFEWFVFERAAEDGGEPLAPGLFDAWMERADVDLQVHGNALLHSRTGVFEVGDVEPGEGLWIHDLLGHGAFPITEAEASDQLETGDLLAGRIFPAGESQFRLSPAVACFRNDRLREALRADLDNLRGGRRGTLRLAQIEIERMFFGPREVGHADPTVARASAVEVAERLRTEFRDLLVEGGVDADRADAWLESLRAAARSTDASEASSLRAELLDQLAFETEVDLERARGLVGEAWTAFGAVATPGQREAGDAATDAEVSSGEDVAPPTTGRPPSGSPADGREAVARALDNFDAGRAAGRDLDQLFNALEQELGLESDEEDDGATVPDFPDVVAAVVQEYLWEQSQNGAVGATARTTLEALATFTRGLGVFEDLGAEHLVAFATRWAVDRGLIRDRDAAVAVLAELERFARWVEDAHQMPLWTAFERRAGELEADLPRAAEVNAALGSGGVDVGDPKRYRVSEDLAVEALGLDIDGGWRPLAASDEALARIRAGDHVAVDLNGPDARVLRVYVPQVLDLDPAAQPEPEPDTDTGEDD